MHSQDESIKAINLEHSVHIMRVDGILEMHCVNQFYGLKEMKEIINAHVKLTRGGRVPILIITDEFSNIDAEAREFMASEEGTQCSLAEAYVLKSLAQHVLGNFYLKLNKPKVPTRFFRDKRLAEDWLSSFLK